MTAVCHSKIICRFASDNDFNFFFSEGNVLIAFERSICGRKGIPSSHLLSLVVGIVPHYSVRSFVGGKSARSSGLFTRHCWWTTVRLTHNPEYEGDRGLRWKGMDN